MVGMRFERWGVNCEGFKVRGFGGEMAGSNGERGNWKG